MKPKYLQTITSGFQDREFRETLSRTHLEMLSSAHEGSDSAWYYAPRSIARKVVAQLKRDGFKSRHHKVDNCANDNIFVSWRK